MGRHTKKEKHTHIPSYTIFITERLHHYIKRLNLDREYLKLLSISTVHNPTLGYINTGGSQAL